MSVGPYQARNLSNDPAIRGLRELLLENRDKRVVVVGGTCTGKTTMIPYISDARDQDREVFPTLSQVESDYVCQEPWTEEIGRTMTRLVRERVSTKVGQPLFGTVVIDADLVVLLKISDSLLKERVGRRKVRFEDAKGMQAQLEQAVRESGIPWVEFSVG